ncbi:MAG: hypothetical protein HW421_2625 [Ignavibacteria bacterium]|nr:hypothetical protein [Ignavibacteria bacterium]
MKKSLYLFITLMICYNSYAQGYIWTEQTGAGNRKWYSIASSADGTKLIAGGSEFEFIYLSTNSGYSWDPSKVRIDSIVMGAYFLSSSNDGVKIYSADGGWTPPGGYIYSSTNSGLTWTQLTVLGRKRWWGIASSSDGVKLVASTFDTFDGFIYTSSNSGSSWIKQSTIGIKNWRGASSSSDGTKLAAAAYNDYIFTSTNSGNTWIQQTTAGINNWRGISMSSDGMKIVAAPSGGYISISTDFGLTWNQSTSAGIRNWNFSSCSSDGNFLAVGDNGGFIYTSFDVGKTWYKQEYAGNRLWWQIALSSDGQKIAAVAFEGYIYTGTYAEIKISTLGSLQWCPNTSLTVQFTNIGTFNPGNIFSVQLSDSTGDFTNPDLIGSLESTNPGPINCFIPQNIASGNAYRIRIAASNPSLIGFDNGSDIRINPLPKPQIAGSNSACENTVSQFISNSINENDSWSVQGGSIQGISTGKTVNIIWGNAGSGNITLVQKNESTGCIDTTNQQITINPLPTPYISGSKTAMVGSTLQYSGSPIPSATYKWTVTGGTIQGASTNQLATINWQTEGSGKITLILTTIVGCSGTATYDVTISKAIGLTIQGNLSVCETKTEVYQTTTPNGAESNWYATNGTIQGNNKGDNVNVFWLSKGAGKIKLVQFDISKGWKDSIEKVVTINPQPAVSLAPIANMCLTDSKTDLTAGTPVSGTYTGKGINGNQFDPQVAGVGSHTITYSFTNPEGCSDSKWTTIKVNPLPPIPNITEKDSALYSDAPNGNQWYYIDTLLTGATGSSYKPAKEGFYNLEVTDANGCKNRNSAPYYFPSGGQDPIITSVQNINMKNLLCESFGYDTLKITNQGGSALSISKINITGADAGMFTFVPPVAQIQILAKETKNLPFIFKPTSKGDKQSQFEITSNAKNKNLFIVTIKAKKDSVGFRLSTTSFKFRNVPESTPVTLFDTIFNTGSLPITWQIPGDISADFSIFSISPMTTQPNSTSVIKALFNGGLLGYSKIFQYQLTESQCNRQIEVTFDAYVGIEAGATVQVGNAEAAVGELIDIPFYLRNASDLQKAGVSGFTADLRYNASLLQSESSILQSELSADSTERIVHLSFGISPKIDSTLEKYAFRAMLGNDSVTTLKLENIKPKNGSAVFDAVNGIFRLKNICREGGPRLITDKGKVSLMLVRPNPAGESAEIEFETVEPDRTQLKLINTLGKIELIIYDGVIEKGIHKFALDLKDISNGSYFLVLQTPYKTRNVRMDVIK